MLRGFYYPMGLVPPFLAAHEEECSRGEPPSPYTFTTTTISSLLCLLFSVHLARRVLKLERINSSLRQQIAAAEHSSEEQEEKLSSLAEQLDLSKQPYKYLVESLKGKDEELRVARDHLAALQDKVQRLDEERRKMAEVKDQLSSDLETLLNHREVNPYL